MRMSATRLSSMNAYEIDGCQHLPGFAFLPLIILRDH
jgi:hypothetical protein